MLEQLENLKKEFDLQLAAAADKNAVLNIKAQYIGKTGKVSEVLADIRDASIEVKKSVGAKSNEIKAEMSQNIDDKLQQFETDEINKSLAENWVDITLTDSKKDLGLNAAGYHPVSIVQREIEDVFISMGFEILDGPHIEDDYHNFEALNIPATHPARDMQDTFWFADMKHLLRTHTSAVQVRGMETRKPPFKFVAPGKVFRCEATDASHESAFHQFEGMMVAENVSVANLIYFMKTLLSEIFKKDVEVRLRPGFFPFVEPGFELDIRCLNCGGKGCSVCKQSGWLELLPCGMVHPNVLKYGGIDTEKYNGFAFGLGLDRLVMMRYKIDDIRHIHGGDLRFAKQFAEF
ncbi:MAG: phenylalanine--tRNA ligase subunit alpha [Chitinivibrionia bacterium]|nr:phenylalanine--tRNA ligase subunit alpha [Chitinivibrionia bacterium]